MTSLNIEILLAADKLYPAGGRGGDEKGRRGEGIGVEGKRGEVRVVKVCKGNVWMKN